MPILVKIYNLDLTKIIALNIYYNMNMAIKHSKGLINYYDIRKKSDRYTTFKKFYKVEKISLSKFLLLNKIISFYTNNNKKCPVQ